ncbi:MAG: antibiotic biosynthesis monooxygenase [Bacteroidetes bacterium]|nr:antibiotic biosynthesis monooxygenase [Bacteroidota bacterium]
MSLIRIVKMTFRPEAVTEFQKIFDERKERIAAAPGCASVELLHDDGCIFFTYSVWEDEVALETYRSSELFNSTWAMVKPLFAARAEAWSVRKVV